MVDLSCRQGRAEAARALAPVAEGGGAEDVDELHERLA